MTGTSQERGNSGVFLQGVYEVQVLDSYDNPTYPDGQCGALYGQSPPLANACKKPAQWQTYDIIFEAARWTASAYNEQPWRFLVGTRNSSTHKNKRCSARRGIGD